jgi:DNA-binding Lrp family transcriptional regulator
VELARRVHLSPSPCLARVKALEAAGVIRQYVALADAQSAGPGAQSVFINISLKSQSKAALAEFERRIAEHDEVMECYLMTGDSDYLIRVALPDMAGAGALHPGAADAHTGDREDPQQLCAEAGALQDGVAVAGVNSTSFEFGANGNLPQRQFPSDSHPQPNQQLERQTGW